MKARPSSSSTTAGTADRAMRCRCRRWTTSRSGASPRASSVWRCAGSPAPPTSAPPSPRSRRPAICSTSRTQCERSPQTRPQCRRRCNCCAILNSHVFDWPLRQKAAVTVNLFILEACPVCELSAPAARFLAHARVAPVLQPRRLCCRCGRSNLGSAGRKHRQPLPGRRWHRGRTGGGCGPPWMRSSRTPTELTDAEYGHILDSFAHKQRRRRHYAAMRLTS